MADLSARLEQLASLHEAGYLSDEEFAAQRDALVASELGRTSREAAAPSTAPHATASASGGHPARVKAGKRTWVGTAMFLGAGAVIATIWTISSGPGSPSVSVGASACEVAFQDASDGSVAGEDGYDLDPAMRACGSLAAWTDAWHRFPPPAGNDPRFVAENRCATGNFDDAAICRELAAH